MDRREVSSRSNPFIRALASALVRTSVSANQISAFSAAVALLVPAGLLCVGGWAGLALALLGIQLRLLANVIDGLVAVEGGKSSPVGALYNEFPDRISDSIILVSIGYAAHLPAAGWCAALFAALTAYVRAFGGALGHPQTFAGPMAKQHRMAVCTGALLLWAGAGRLSSIAGHADVILQAALWIVIVGSAWTCSRRTWIIRQQISQARAPDGATATPTDAAA
jgi:phosphatidylglycerophosphate synthase